MHQVHTLPYIRLTMTELYLASAFKLMELILGIVNPISGPHCYICTLGAYCVWIEGTRERGCQSLPAST